MADAMREAAEHAYTMTAHNYAEAPVGSRDWTLYWRGWQAALAAQQPAQGEAVAVAMLGLDAGRAYVRDFIKPWEGPNVRYVRPLYAAPPAPSVPEPLRQAIQGLLDRHGPAENDRYGEGSNRWHIEQVRAALLASGGKASAPDALRESYGCNPSYIKGWNDCRAAMLAPAPEVKPTGADDDPDEPCSACFVRGCNGECMEGCE